MKNDENEYNETEHPIENPSPPVEDELKRTSVKREWGIKKLQERYGVSREIAERLVDEGHGTG